MFDDILDKITGRITTAAADFWSPFVEWLYLGKWYLLGLGIIFAMVLLGWFWSAVRAYAGVVVLAVIAFLAGMTKMYLYMRGKKPRRK